MSQTEGAVMSNFRELKVWQKSMELSVAVYRATESLPDREKYGLTSQMRRAAVSIASNIAEGAGRGSNPDFRRFLDIAKGSAFELETQLLISKKLSFINKETANKLQHEIVEIQKMISGLHRTL